MMQIMPKPRGREHTTLTETAALVVQALEKIPGVKMIAPGEIRQNARARGGSRFATATLTTAGFELLISGQGAQKIAVHTDQDPRQILTTLQQSKRLANFTFSIRERKPGV